MIHSGLLKHVSAAWVFLYHLRQTHPVAQSHPCTTKHRFKRVHWQLPREWWIF